MSEESVTPPSTTGNSFYWEIIYNYGKGKAKFKEICLKQDSVSIFVANLYISYKLDTWSRDVNTDFTLGDYLFGAVNLGILILKNPDTVIMALDLMPVHKFDGQMVAGVNILLVLELIIVPQWMLIIKKVSSWWRSGTTIRSYYDNMGR